MVAKCVVILSILVRKILLNGIMMNEMNSKGV